MTRSTVKLSLLLPAQKDYASRVAWETACWNTVLQSERLLNALVTPYERRNIIMRAIAINLINSGTGLRQISRDLGISRQTISAVKKAINEAGYVSYWERSKTDRKKKLYSSFRSQKNPYRRYRRTKYGKVSVPRWMV